MGWGGKHFIQNNYLAEEVVAVSRVNLARESALTDKDMEVILDWVRYCPQAPEQISLRDGPNHS